MVRLLIEAGPNPNLGRDNGETPLMLAVKRGDAAAVKLLLDKGADIEIKNKKGLAPLLVAA
jgi:ankyrin repeat protein